jgi:hypothetical protein
LVRKGLPRPGHVEKGKFALWIVGFLGEQDALCRSKAASPTAVRG